jgi:hypothetical protein
VDPGLIELLTIQPESDAASRRPLRLAGARIVEELDLEALTLVRPLVLESCFFEKPIRLDEARASRIVLKDCSVRGISARQLEMRGDLNLEGLLTTGDLDMAGAKLEGDLSLRGVRLQDNTTLMANHLVARMNVDCKHLEARSGLSLEAARIGGYLSFSGARLSNENGAALSADGIQVNGGMVCQAEGDARFECVGELRLPGAHISGILTFNGASLTSGRIALDLEGAEAEQLWLADQDHVSGIVDLTHASVGRLGDGWQVGAGRRGYPHRVRGFTYQALLSGSDEREARLDWLQCAEGGYLPQGYDQLIDVYLRAGRDHVPLSAIRYATVPLQPTGPSKQVSVSVVVMVVSFMPTLSLRLSGCRLPHQHRHRRVRHTRP